MRPAERRAPLHTGEAVPRDAWRETGLDHDGTRDASGNANLIRTTGRASVSGDPSRRVQRAAGLSPYLDVDLWVPSAFMSGRASHGRARLHR